MQGVLKLSRKIFDHPFNLEASEDEILTTLSMLLSSR